MYVLSEKWFWHFMLGIFGTSRLRPVHVQWWPDRVNRIVSFVILNSAFGQEIFDFTNDLQEKIMNQRKADKLNNLMKKLMYVWQKKVWINSIKRSLTCLPMWFMNCSDLFYPILIDENFDEFLFNCDLPRRNQLSWSAMIDYRKANLEHQLRGRWMS